MNDLLFGLLNASSMAGTYEQRKVDNTKLPNKLIVSTCDTDDMGYETAIIDTKDAVHPVERYPNRESAVKGHKKWVKFASKGIGKKITKLGYGNLVDSCKITLE